MSQADNDKIVAFPGAAPAEIPENPVTITDKRYNLCEHPKIDLNTHERVVTCVTCGATLDPFNFLLHNGRMLQRAWSDHRSVKLQVIEFIERIDALKKEEKRLKGVIRRMQEKTAPLDVRGKDRL